LIQSSVADEAVAMQALPPRAGNRRDTLMRWPRRFFDTLSLLREALASDVTWSNMSTGE